MVSVHMMTLLPIRLEGHLSHEVRGIHVDGACSDCELAGGFFVRVEQSRMSKSVSCSHRLHPGKEREKSKEIHS